MSGKVAERSGVRVQVDAAGATINALACEIAISEDIRIELVVDSDEEDGITSAVLLGTYSIPRHFRLLVEMARLGQNVLDLGAHIGTFSLFAAALGYHVVAVEASPRNSALLQESARKNGFNRLKVISAAASNRREELAFIQAGPYGYVATPPLPISTIRVQAITAKEILSGLDWDSVDFIKMDVEGSEVKAIEGMSELLTSEHAPTILFESNGHTLNNFGETPNSLLASLESLGYVCYVVQSGQLVPTKAFEFQPFCLTDCLAIKGRLPELREWVVRPPFTIEEKRNLALSTCSSPHRLERAYIARAFGQAKSSQLMDKRIMNALGKLARDEDVDVRAAMFWFGSVDSGLNWRQRSRILGQQGEAFARLEELVAAHERGRIMRALKVFGRFTSSVRRWFGM